jgi:thymidylate synthase ThyX
VKLISKQQEKRMVRVKIIEDSIPTSGKNFTRLTTMEVTIHRFVLAEFNTHRDFSRNSASSRAIPIQKRIEEVKRNPALPLSWGKNKSGMSAEEELSSEDIKICKRHWLNAAENAVYTAEILSKLGLHKQIVNRVLEPFLWHKIIVTSTRWDNFFKQRIHPAAQPEIRIAAEAMKYALSKSVPVERQIHLPYVSSFERSDFPLYTLKQISAARCARVSYLNHDGEYSVEKDLELYNKLDTQNPPHYSPLEHVAMVPELVFFKKTNSNFDHWIQFRKERESFENGK